MQGYSAILTCFVPYRRRNQWFSLCYPESGIGSENELTVACLSEDPWLVLYKDKFDTRGRRDHRSVARRFIL